MNVPDTVQGWVKKYMDEGMSFKEAIERVESRQRCKLPEHIVDMCRIRVSNRVFDYIFGNQVK